MSILSLRRSSRYSHFSKESQDTAAGVHAMLVLIHVSLLLWNYPKKQNLSTLRMCRLCDLCMYKIWHQLGDKFPHLVPVAADPRFGKSERMSLHVPKPARTLTRCFLTELQVEICTRTLFLLGERKTAQKRGQKKTSRQTGTVLVVLCSRFCAVFLVMYQLAQVCILLKFFLLATLCTRFVLSIGNWMRKITGKMFLSFIYSVRR